MYAGRSHGVHLGGRPPPGYSQGLDGLTLPKVQPCVKAEVAWAISCRNDGGKVAEECFQHTPLRSVGDASWIAFVNGPRTAIPRTTVRVGGCEWVRNPVPARKMCSRSRMAEVGHLLGHVVARGKTVLIPARPGPVLVVPADLEPGGGFTKDPQIVGFSEKGPQQGTENPR